MSAKQPALTKVIHCAPRQAPCPSCGALGRRKRRLSRRVRSLAYGREAFLLVHYGEYKARCPCRKSFRNHPPDVLPRADYDALVRQAVLDRLLGDGLNVERTKAALRRDFLLGVSTGFVYDCLDWQLRQLNLPARRRQALGRFSGTLCVDELHLGRFTLLLATDPLADQVVGFAVVKVNDQAHLRRFLLMLKHWGFLPEVVVSDGSALYPAVLAEVWPRARHQLCIFHVLRDVTKEVLNAVRRLRRGLSRRGHAGRRRKGGRPRKGAPRRARRRGPTNKEKAAFVFKRRHLIVKRQENLSERERADLKLMMEYLPALRVLHRFGQEAYRLWRAEQSPRVARWRWGRLKGNPDYQQVPELRGVLGWLDEPKFQKTQAFLGQPVGERVRTNNHVERANRRLRFDEKVRYKWRRRRSVVRFVLLRISRDDAVSGDQVEQPAPRRAGAG
jgi:Transposase